LSFLQEGGKTSKTVLNSRIFDKRFFIAKRLKYLIRIYGNQERHEFCSECSD
jgi:hypothetical protein